MTIGDIIVLILLISAGLFGITSTIYINVKYKMTEY